MNRGCFTLPGETGYEKLTLDLASRWGADVIRDSDGTSLSEELLESGYKIYSTICIIRDHNEWISKNKDTRQQSFLCTFAKIASGNSLKISLMEDFFDGQFEVDNDKQALEYMQVHDRTTGCLVKDWEYLPAEKAVIVKTEPFHQYTVNFLAWRIWEEISMYNHTTNNWTKERLMQLDPYHPKAMEYLKEWLYTWCKEHPHTDVVRFTSLFYNFAWIWGSDPKNRNIFTDWGSYDFTVSIPALKDFEKEYGYSLCAEDFTNGGRYHSSHSVPDSKKRDWMTFIGSFVRNAGKELIDIVKSYGKEAYVFYDDSWVGIEPYNGHFTEYEFDGLIKCVFSGFEVRLCSNADVPTHEIRLHPYLFPVGLGGAPTFSPGGAPEKDAMNYWKNIRRALLRTKIERIGLGGYLHYVEEYPKFAEAIDTITDQFHGISDLHKICNPDTFKPKIAVLTAWGSLRTWTLSGHFHETDKHVLIHLLESLSGMAFDVNFISFEDINRSKLSEYDIVINAGEGDSAWSGGEHWDNPEIVTTITEWVYGGGVFLGVKEPSAFKSGTTLFKLSHILGVDYDTGERCCHGRWQGSPLDIPGLIPEGVSIKSNEQLYLTSRAPMCAYNEEGHISVVLNHCGKGMGIFLSDFSFSAETTRLLQNLLLYAAGNTFENADGITDNINTEISIFKDAGKAILINNSLFSQNVKFRYSGKLIEETLTALEMKIVSL